MTLSYDYSTSKAYCEQIGLVWLGDDYAGLVNADAAARSLEMTQEQVDMMMRHHLWQVQQLFEPKNYKFLARVGIALYFLTGKKLKSAL